MTPVRSSPQLVSRVGVAVAAVVGFAVGATGFAAADHGEFDSNIDQLAAGGAPTSLADTGDADSSSGLEISASESSPRFDSAPDPSVVRLPVPSVSPSTTVGTGPASTVTLAPDPTVDDGPTTTVDEGPASTVTIAPDTTVAEGPASTVTIAPGTTVDEGPASTVHDGPSSTVDDDGPASTLHDGPSSTVDDDGPSTTVEDGPSSTVDDDGPSTTVGSVVPAPFTDSYSSVGGSISVTWSGSAFTLNSVAPHAGFRAEVEDLAWDRIRVDFEGDDADGRIEVRINDGRLRVRID